MIGKRLVGLGFLLVPVAAAAASDKTPAPPPTPQAHVAAIFEDEAYGFCHRRDYPLTAEEIAWCPLWAQTEKDEKDHKAEKAPCPALAPACARGPQANLMGRTGRFELSLPAVPAGAQTVLWITLVAGFLALLVFLARHLVAGRLPRRSQAQDQPTAPTAPAPETAAAQAVLTDVDRLLARARQAAETGDYPAAVADTHAALLRRLAGAHLVEVDRQFTKGDYLAHLAERGPHLSPRIEPILTEVERLQFSTTPATRADFEGLWQRVLGVVAERLLPLTALLLAALSSGCGLSREGWEFSPSGRQAVLDLVARSGGKLSERFSDLGKLDDEVDGIVLLPGAELDPDTWQHLLGWVRKGGALLVAGHVAGAPAWFGRRAGTAPAATPPRNNDPLSVEPSKAQLWPQTHGQVPPGVAIDPADCPPDWTPLLARPSGIYAIEGAYGDGDIVVLADDYLLQNAALLVSGNAGLVLGLVHRLGKRVELVGDLTGLVAKHAVDSVERGRLLPAVLQLLLLFILFFAWKGAHFGRPLEPAPPPRRAFVEHVRALAIHYRRAHGGRHVLRAYSAWAVERLRQRLRRSGDGRLSSLAEAVAARSDIPLSEVMRALVEAQVPRDRGDTADASDSAAALATMTRLSTLLARTGGPIEREQLQRPV